MSDIFFDSPYTPRPIWAEVIHPALDTKRQAVLVCHRRFGKTVGCVNELIKKAFENQLRAPVYWYLAPYLKQAKRIAWEYLKYYTAGIPGRKVNNSELYVELPPLPIHPNSPGARIYIMGADYPDSLRGSYLDGIILDEYAQIKPEIYGEIVKPQLTDRNGFSIFIGTPKGQNQFYEIYNKAQRDNRFLVCRYDVYDSKVLTPEQIEDAKKDMTDVEFRQEMLCDFTASASNVVIPIDLVTEAAARNIRPDQVAGMPLILSVDVARFGDDDSVLTWRQGLWMDKQIRLHGLNTMELANYIANLYYRKKPDAIIIDAGAMGAGVIDRLREMGIPNVFEINFGQQANDPNRFANIRAEIYFKMLEWLKAGGCIPNEPRLKSELTVTEYKFTSAGKIILQPKEEIKELTGHSPDGADSAVLTFAVQIHKATTGRRRVLTANTEYSFA